MAFKQKRMRRLRQHPRIRDLIRQTRLSIDDLVLPLFIREEGDSQPIASMPGHSQLSLQDLATEVQAITQLKLPAVLLFGIPANKDAEGSFSWRPNGVIQQAIRPPTERTFRIFIRWNS